MLKIFVRFIFFVSAGTLLVGCNQQKPTAIEKACISEGSKVAECRCMGDALKSELPTALFDALETEAANNGAMGLAKAMLALSEQDRYSVGNIIVEACGPDGGSDAPPVSETTTNEMVEQPEILSADAAMSKACQIDGNTPKMCDCWADYVKENVSSETYKILAGGAVDGGNEGLSLGVQAFNEQEQMAVGLTMMEAQQICVKAE